ncbi:hypothetical protein R3Q06_30655 [Rhodococcus erythropolis]|uniref:hypothetical protein n=1 Tax=Rhodococcus erythropolis TaxID=1833 RepID=UPI00294A0E26|nr:hypothetical protein [Rhodococcus erythropolis]MDV6277853.1 hypothetical protein [Rhodococcus erythropolis]
MNPLDDAYAILQSDEPRDQCFIGIPFAARLSVAITPNGTRAYVVNGGDNTVSVISIESGCTGSLCSFGS